MYRTLLAIGALVFYGIGFGQPGSGVASDQTFHVEGIIDDPTGAVIPQVEVHFVGIHGDQTVITDNKGLYQADLPLGAYTMTAVLPPFGPNRLSLFKRYVRFFRVISPTNITLNGSLYQTFDCDGVWAGEDKEEAYKDSCGGEDSFPFPSPDAVPFRLDIRFGRRKRGENLASYSSGTTPKQPVSLTYNLFALRADSVRYIRTDGTIKAYGHVVIEDQSGRTSTSSAAFKFDDGQAIRIW